ncbi:hypothetical protein [Allorhizocola rhizosphaerae]|uniref:hypothetical protein n=1 Tax=Allorhizocola rhizosphaerae TaxID=1872709 RepID=UPI001FE46D72|nr:hypothetical protein [Allorhizocola rhizosphaerae]
MKRILHLVMLSAGRYRREYRRTLIALGLASIAQAAAYATLIPLLYELTRPQVDAATAWRWLAVFVACYLVELALRLYELRFQYGSWAGVLADVRLRLGESLRTMPQAELARRASDDFLSGTGRENACCTRSPSPHPNVA